MPLPVCCCQGQLAQGTWSGKKVVRGYVGGGGLHQDIVVVVVASFGVSQRAQGRLGGGVIGREGWGKPSRDPWASGHEHSPVKSHSEGKRWASFIYLCLKYLSVTRAIL